MWYNIVIMLAKYYLEIDIICILVLVSLAYQTVHSNFRKTNQVRFLEVLIVNAHPGYDTGSAYRYNRQNTSSLLYN